MEVQRWLCEASILFSQLLLGNERTGGSLGRPGYHLFFVDVILVVRPKSQSWSNRVSEGVIFNTVCVAGQCDLCGVVG